MVVVWCWSLWIWGDISMFWSVGLNWVLVLCHSSKKIDYSSTIKPILYLSLYYILYLCDMIWK